VTAADWVMIVVCMESCVGTRNVEVDRSGEGESIWSRKRSFMLSTVVSTVVLCME